MIKSFDEKVRQFYIIHYSALSKAEKLFHASRLQRRAANEKNTNIKRFGYALVREIMGVACHD